MFGTEKMMALMVRLKISHVADNFQLAVAAAVVDQLAMTFALAQKRKIHCENFVGMMTKSDLAAAGNSSSCDFLEGVHEMQLILSCDTMVHS